MGIPGVPFNCTKEEILDAIKKSGGRFLRIAALLNYADQTVRTHIYADPDLMQALKDARNTRDEGLLDGAEDTLKLALEKAGVDMNSALKSAFYVLNNKGKERGYQSLDERGAIATAANLAELAKHFKESDVKQS
jgi:hypothetical protein